MAYLSPKHKEACQDNYVLRCFESLVSAVRRAELNNESIDEQLKLLQLMLVNLITRRKKERQSK